MTERTVEEYLEICKNAKPAVDKERMEKIMKEYRDCHELILQNAKKNERMTQCRFSSDVPALKLEAEGFNVRKNFDLKGNYHIVFLREKDPN